jgi:7-dehydrocholesterol reductase
VKQFTNCRFGMMFWQLGIICFAFKQYELEGAVSSSMLVSVAVQTVYIAKFFYWETGYFCSMDIQHDRAGYYICWGCLVWVPAIYTVHTFYLVTHPVALSIPCALSMAAAGILSIWINYDCDRQRQTFRVENGKLRIWGAPARYVEASYETAKGEQRKSLLLTSGWWGLSRHFHYIPEILASVMWCAPAMDGALLPYFYPFYLTMLLLDRAWRDDARCAAKVLPLLFSLLLFSSSFLLPCFSTSTQLSSFYLFIL